MHKNLFSETSYRISLVLIVLPEYVEDLYNKKVKVKLTLWPATLGPEWE
jgi:hypothetical protein